MNDNKPLQFSSVLDRIKSYQAKQAAESTDSVADPTNKGTVAIPTDSEATNAKGNMPANMDNTVSNEGTKLEDKQLKPVSTGKNVPSTQDGNAKENVSSPTDALSKIAARVSAVTDKLKAAKLVDVKDKTEKTAPKPKADEVAGAPDSAKNTEVTGKEAPVTAAKKAEDANDSIASDISPEALMKLASTIMATEGGLEAVEPVLRKAAGIEATRQIVADACASYDKLIADQIGYQEYVKAAAEREAAANMQAEVELNTLLKSASAEDREQIVKYASTHREALANIESDMLKQAYMQGAQDAAAMQDAAPPAGAEGAPAEGAEGELPGAEGPASLEQIAELLEAMVQSGEIDEQTAMGIMQELAQAEQGGAAAEGAPADPAAAEAAMPAGAEGAPAGAAEEMPPEKGASVTDFQKSSALCVKLISNIK